jgi:S1-C subfamily serine protease
MRRIHVALTAILALAVCTSIWLWSRDHAEADAQLRAKTQENIALKKRAELAEANTKLVIERFSDAMKTFANEAGHLSGRSLRNHEKSFVQVYGFYRQDRKSMAIAGTACYLGNGYFLTAKHVVVQEGTPGKPAAKTTGIDIKLNGEMVPVRLIDSGSTQEADQVDIEDWALLEADRAPEGLVALKPNATYAFTFGERLVRYGNDSNRGIAPAAGYVAQVSENGWVSWLVDSLPGCSGGGVLNSKDELVGLNGGYLDGNTRLAVIIPIRAEMFRKLPKLVPDP